MHQTTDLDGSLTA